MFHEPYHTKSVAHDKSRISSKTHKNDLHYTDLKKENRELRKELHKLRKMEAGWFGRNKNYVKKEVIVRNNHYHDEIERINSEYTTLTERYNNLELERNSLLDRIRHLEAELAQYNTHGSRIHHDWLAERSKYQQDIDLLNKRIELLSREKDTLRRSSYVKTAPVLVESNDHLAPEL